MSQHGDQHATRHHHAKAGAEQALELGGILRPVVVADDGRGADCKSHEKRHRNPSDVLDNAVNCDAIRTDISHQLEVVDHRHERHGKVRDEFRRAVHADTPQSPHVNKRATQAQRARVRPREIEERDRTAKDLAYRRRQGSTRQAPLEHDDEQGIERDVSDASNHHDAKPHLGLACSGQQALEGFLQHEEWKRERQDAAVHDAFLKQRAFGP